MKTTLRELHQLIVEVLKTSDAEGAAQAIRYAAERAGGQARVTVDTSGRMLNVFARIVSGDPETVEAAMVARADDVGWSLLSKSDRGGSTLWFEPKPEIKGTVSSRKIPMTLWHVTAVDNAPGILERGLEPRVRSSSYAQTSRRYSPRVYLGTSEASTKATINRPGDWVVLKIDTRKLRGAKFYVDQEFGHNTDGVPRAVYTLDPIPPGAISLAEPSIREAVAVNLDCWGGSRPEEAYDEELVEDDAWQAHSVLVPDDVKGSINAWMKKMGLAGSKKKRTR